LLQCPLEQPLKVEFENQTLEMSITNLKDEIMEVEFENHSLKHIIFDMK
jgi:hypothetical protein